MGLVAWVLPLVAFAGWFYLPRSGGPIKDSLSFYARLTLHVLGWLPRSRFVQYGQRSPPAPRPSNGTIHEVQGFVDAETFREKYMGKRPVVFRGGATAEFGFDLDCLVGNGSTSDDAMREVMIREAGPRQLRVFTDEMDDGSAIHMTMWEYDRLVAEAKANSSKPMPYARSFPQTVLDRCKQVIPTDRLKYAYRRLGALTFMPEESSLIFYSMGEGTTTKMHIDIGDSFFTEVYGRKKWVFVEPEYTEQLHTWADKMNLVFIAGYDVHREPLPLEVPVREVILYPGDILYFPPMTYHAVINLDPVTLGIDQAVFDPLGALPRHWLLTMASTLNPVVWYAVLKQLWFDREFSAHRLYFDEFSENTLKK